MKVIVSDTDILKTIELKQLRDYLQVHGWQEDYPFLDNATIWHKQEPERGEFEILLPNRQNLGDYVVRLREAIATLEAVENCSQIEIMRELITAMPNFTVQAVVMQIKPPHPDNLSGYVTLLGVVFERLCQIKTNLSDRAYILAIKAYQERLPILCTGDLIKENNSFILKDPRNFTLEHLVVS